MQSVLHEIIKIEIYKTQKSRKLGQHSLHRLCHLLLSYLFYLFLANLHIHLFRPICLHHSAVDLVFPQFLAVQSSEQTKPRNFLFERFSLVGVLCADNIVVVVSLITTMKGICYAVHCMFDAIKSQFIETLTSANIHCLKLSIMIVRSHGLRF